MITLQINHIGSQDGKMLFEVMRMSDGKRCPSVELTPPSAVLVSAHNTTLRQDLRWYLEDYLSMPIDVYRTRADNVQDTLKQWGRDCFNALFTGRAQNWYYTAQQGGLKNLTIKVASDDPAVLAYPWEALYSDDDEYIAQQCRIERQLSNVVDLRPLTFELPQNQLNILYIIARPYGERDVDFQSLARPLVDFVVEGNWAVRVDLLRPPTFERLREVLQTKPNHYHIVHFDGHGGTYEQVDIQTNMLVFEKENDPNNEGDVIPSDKLSALLCECNVPYMVLNACQSAMMDETVKDPFSSVAVSLLRAGVQGVVAMSYSLWVNGAKAFVPAFYKRLFEEGDIAEAMRAGRQEMYRKNMRDTVIGHTEFNDWIVPVLYCQANNDQILPKLIKGAIKRDSFLPAEVNQLLSSDFIGRNGAIQTLERVMRNEQAGILIHGMAGEGKTTLVQGFLQWMEATGGLEADAFWFDFGAIHSTSYVVNTLTDRLFGTQAIALPIEQKLLAIVKILRSTPIVMVWDSFESVSGYGNVMGLLSEDDRNMLKDLLRELQGGKTKILITSRSPEDWLDARERLSVRLEGLKGEELWQYCNAVVSDLGLNLDRDDPDYKPLIDKLQGNPLSTKVILMRLEKYSSKVLLDEFIKGEFQGNDDTAESESLFWAVSIFNNSFTNEYISILKFVGLHEQFVDADYIKQMIVNIGEKTDNVESCFKILERAGLCYKIGGNRYKTHPILRTCLNQLHPVANSERSERIVYVNFMGMLCDEYGIKSLYEQRPVFELFGINFRNALEMANELNMQSASLLLIQGLASYAQNNRNFEEAEMMSKMLAETAITSDAINIEATAYHKLGMIAEARRDFNVAEEWFVKSLEISLKLGDDLNAASVYYQLGMIAEARRDFESAENYYNKSLEISLKLGNEITVANIYHQMGVIARKLGNAKKAEKWYKESLTIKLKQGDEYGVASTYQQLGMVAYDFCDFLTAEQWCKKSLEIWLKLSDEHNAADAYQILGMIAYRLLDLVAAEDWYKYSLAIKLKQGDEHGAAEIYYHLGVLEQKCENFDAAVNWYNQSLAIMLKLNDEHFAVSIYCQLGIIAESTMKFESAEHWYQSSLACALKTGDVRKVSQLYRDLARYTDKQHIRAIEKNWNANDWNKVAEEILLVDRTIIRTLDRNILVSSPTDALRYLATLKSKDERVMIRGAKVLLLGSGGAGKSSLAYLWQTGKVDENPNSTRGIKIWKTETKVEGDDCDIRIWDFGGQEIYRPFQTLLFSDKIFCDKVICVILLDSQKEEKPDEWLHYIEMFANGSPVYLVLNKIDRCPRADVNIVPYIQRKNVRNEVYNHLFKVSCRYPTESIPKGEFDVFTRNVGSYIKEHIKDYRVQYSRQWVDIWKETVEQRGSKYLTGSEFAAICSKYGIDEEDEDTQATIMNAMSRLGVALCFEVQHREIYVFNPNWVTDGIYRILDACAIDNKLLLNGTTISFENIRESLQKDWGTGVSDSRYSRKEDASNLLCILTSRRLCISINNSNINESEQYFIPALLTAKAPSTHIPNRSKWATLEYRFNFLPPSLLYQMLVKLWTEISNNKPKPVTWRYGALLYFKEYDINAVIESTECSLYFYVEPGDSHARQCDIFVTLCRKMDETLRENEINDNSVELLAKVFVIPDEEYSKSEEYISLKTLQRLNKRGIKHYHLPQSLFEITIDEILSQYCSTDKESNVLFTGGMIMFNKLFGKRREIVESIHDKSDFEAKICLINKYADSNGTLESIVNELKSLERDDFIKLNLAQTTLIELKVLPDCRDYFVKEKEYERNLQVNQTIINAPNNSGNIVGRDASNVSQSVKTGLTEKSILELISEMKNLANTLTVDPEIKDNVLDDLDIIKEQIESPTPKASRIRRAMQSVENLLAPIKNMTTVTTLLVHLNTLTPIIAKMLQEIGDKL